MATPKRNSVRKIAAVALDPVTDESGSERFQARKAEIIAAFRTVLIREGHAALSMRRIADECGMKLGNLQYYFPTRDDLVDAFVGDWIRVEHAERQLLISKNLSPLKAIQKWIDDAFTHLTKRHFENGVAMVGLWALTCHDQRAQSRQRQWYEEQREYYGRMVAAAKPQLSADTARERASLLMAMFEGLVTQLVIKGADEGELATARAALRAAARAIVMAPA